MKMIVKSKGANLYDFQTLCEIHAKRPSVVERSQFITTRVALGELKILADEVPDEAEDADFGLFWKDHDCDDSGAVANFLAKFESPVEEEEPKPKRGRRAASKKDTE